MSETALKLSNGWTLRSDNGNNVRLCEPDGTERIYWDQNEWHEDPVGVMAAIFGAATRLPTPTSDEFLNPFERTVLTAAIRQLGFLERANKFVSLGLTFDRALFDAFIDWYRAQPTADNDDSVKQGGDATVTWDVTITEPDPDILRMMRGIGRVEDVALIATRLVAAARQATDNTGSIDPPLSADERMMLLDAIDSAAEDLNDKMAPPEAQHYEPEDLARMSEYLIELEQLASRLGRPSPTETIEGIEVNRAAFNRAPMPVNCMGTSDEEDCADDPTNPCRACFLWDDSVGRSRFWDDSEHGTGSVNLRPATPQEELDFHGGHRTIPGAVEIEHGLLVPDVIYEHVADAPDLDTYVAHVEHLLSNNEPNNPSPTLDPNRPDDRRGIIEERVTDLALYLGVEFSGSAQREITIQDAVERLMIAFYDDDDGYADMASRALTAGLTAAERTAAADLAERLTPMPIPRAGTYIKDGKQVVVGVNGDLSGDLGVFARFVTVAKAVEYVTALGYQRTEEE